MAWTLADLEEQLLIGSTLVEGSTLTEDEARQSAFRFMLRDRLEHLAALEASDRDDPAPLEAFFRARIRETGP